MDDKRAISMHRQSSTMEGIGWESHLCAPSPPHEEQAGVSDGGDRLGVVGYGVSQGRDKPSPYYTVLGAV